jgi:hypothetical protein
MSVKVLVGAFENYGQCRDVIAELLSASIDPQKISVIGCYPCPLCLGTAFNQDGFSTGAAIGTAALDALVGRLIGAGILCIPSVGSFVVAGPLKSTFNLPTEGGGITITDTLVRFNVPEYEAMVYEALLLEHKIVIAVHVDEPTERERTSTVMEEFQAIMTTPRPTSLQYSGQSQLL